MVDAITCPYSVVMPYSICPVVAISVVHEIFALVVAIPLDETEVMVAGVVTKIGVIKVENSCRPDTVATFTPRGFDFTRKM